MKINEIIEGGSGKADKIVGPSDVFAGRFSLRPDSCIIDGNGQAPGSFRSSPRLIGCGGQVRLSAWKRNSWSGWPEKEALRLSRSWSGNSSPRCSAWL